LTPVVDVIVEVDSSNNNQTPAFLLRRCAINEREVMNIRRPRRTPYSPASASPLRLATATIDAVDRIGLTACGEIEETADDIAYGANEVADSLRKLETAIREHGKVASVHVTDFCTKATIVTEGVRDLRTGCSPGGPEPEVTEDDKSPLPEVIRGGRPTATIMATTKGI